MSVEENKALIRRLVEEGWANPDILDELVAADFVTLGGARGLDALKQFLSRVLTGFPDARWAVEDIIAEGDKVVVRFKFSGTHTGEWRGIPPTNKQISFGGAHTYRIAGGKVAEALWGHSDSFTMYPQLGVTPPLKELIEQAKAKLA